MFIVHVVTLISPSGAYGGPVRVALNQLVELKRRGHEVLLVAGHAGYTGTVPSAIDGVDVALFPVRRLSRGSAFATLVSPSMLNFLRKILPSVDIFHLHLGRDFIMMPAGLLIANANKPFVIQTHGMITGSNRLAIRVVDLFLVKRIVRHSRRVLYLTGVERRQLLDLFPEQAGRLARLVNGVPEVVGQPDRPAVLTFLFLARLHPRKNPLVFVEAAILRIKNDSNANFVLVGPDEGELARCLEAIEEAGVEGRVRYAGSLDYGSIPGVLSEASVLALPSVDEPFPMSVLEALSHGVPVLITESNGLADDVRRSEAGFIVEPSAHALAGTMERIESNESSLCSMAENGIELIRSKFLISAIEDEVDRVYAEVARVP